MPLIKRTVLGANGKPAGLAVVDVSVNQMSSDEYEQWLRDNPEEVKKIDEPVEQARAGKKQAFFQNGRYTELTDNSQSVSNGQILPSGTTTIVRNGVVR